MNFKSIVRTTAVLVASALVISGLAVLTSTESQAAVVPVSGSQMQTMTTEIFNRINSERSARGLVPLARSSYADGKASQVAVHQASSGTLDNHAYYNSNKNSWYPFSGSLFLRGENLARTSPSGTTGSAVVLWMGSTMHRTAMLSPGFSHAGVGVACASDGRMYTVFHMYASTSKVGSQYDSKFVAPKTPVTTNSSSGTSCPSKPIKSVPPSTKKVTTTVKRTPTTIKNTTTRPPAAVPPSTVSTTTTRPRNTIPPTTKASPVTRPSVLSPSTTSPRNTIPPVTVPPSTRPPATIPPSTRPSTTVPPSTRPSTTVLPAAPTTAASVTAEPRISLVLSHSSQGVELEMSEQNSWVSVYIDGAWVTDVRRSGTFEYGVLADLGFPSGNGSTMKVCLGTNCSNFLTY